MPNTPEEIRHRISEMMREAIDDKNLKNKISPEMCHLLVEMSFRMHQIGMMEAFNSVRKMIDILEKEFTK